MQLPPLTLRIPHPPPNHQGDGSIVTRAPLGQLLASAPSGSDKGLAQTFVERAHTLPDLASVLDATAPLSCPLATALAKDVRGVGCSRGGGGRGVVVGWGLPRSTACLPACLCVCVCQVTRRRTGIHASRDRKERVKVDKRELDFALTALGLAQLYTKLQALPATSQTRDAFPTGLTPVHVHTLAGKRTP